MNDPATKSFSNVEATLAPRDAAAPPPVRRRLSGAWIATFATLPIMLGLAIYLLEPSTLKPADPKSDVAPPIPVGAARAVRGDFGVTLEALGAVTPIATVLVKSQISGRIVEIGFTEGQMVKEGDFLAEIDPRPYQYALHQAQGQLLRDQALLNNAKLDLERYRLLVKQDSAPRQQRDTQESLVEQYKGAVEIDQAQVDTAQLNLDYCHITAPVAGRVGLRQVDLGNYVSAGDANGLVVITQLQPITVVFPVAEDHLPVVMKQLLAGKKLAVSVYDRAGTTLLANGVLATVDNQVDPTTGTVKFKAQFGNLDLALFPNQFVNVRLLAETLRDALIIPSAAIQYGPKGAFVYEVLADNKVATRPVTLRAAETDKAAVFSDLAPGARVVTDGADRLRDGAEVKASDDK